MTRLATDTPQSNPDDWPTPMPAPTAATSSYPP
jgi:hypothetical protein